MKVFYKIIPLFFLIISSACKQKEKQTINEKMKENNPVVYFEIPVTDIERAEKFYSNVFNFKFEKEIIDDYEMVLFPFEESRSGISGALAKGDVYKPSKDGTLIYLKTKSISSTLKKVTENKGKIIYPKTINSKYGFAVAEFQDSEGNRIALHETIKN